MFVTKTKGNRKKVSAHVKMLDDKTHRIVFLKHLGKLSARL